MTNKTFHFSIGFLLLGIILLPIFFMASNLQIKYLEIETVVVGIALLCYVGVALYFFIKGALEEA